MCVVLRLSALTLSSQNRKPDSSLGPHVPKAWDEAALADWANRWQGWMCGPVTSRKRSTTLYRSRTCASTRCITRAGSLKARRLYVQVSVIGMARLQLFRKRSWASRLILLGIRGVSRQSPATYTQPTQPVKRPNFGCNLLIPLVDLEGFEPSTS